VLYREPMWLKCSRMWTWCPRTAVSVLYREPMWLKLPRMIPTTIPLWMFQCSTVSRCG